MLLRVLVCGMPLSRGFLGRRLFLAGVPFRGGFLRRVRLLLRRVPLRGSFLRRFFRVLFGREIIAA